jgi:hypothetical protein
MADPCLPESPVLSPDGGLRVEWHDDWDDRSGPWHYLRIVEVASGRVQVSLSGRNGWGAIRFPRPGIVAVSMKDASGQWREVRLNAFSGGFRFEGGEVDEPIARLDECLGWRRPPAVPVSPSPLRAFTARIGNALNAIGTLLFTAAGLWMAWAGKTSKDRWIGVLCALFFGACASVPLIEWRQARRARRRTDKTTR